MTIFTPGEHAKKKIHPDIFGLALLDYHKGQFMPPLIRHNTYGSPEQTPIDGYFFDGNDFSEMEHFALSLCRGTVLDVGAAAGRHALSLQLRGIEVKGLEISQSCCTLMHERGVRNIIHADIQKFDDGIFDTIILMMNGIGLAGTMKGLMILLKQLNRLLAPGGQVLFDSSDVAYLYEGLKRPKGRYYGEIDYKYEYKGQAGNWFSWLYVDMKTMLECCKATGWAMQVIYEDETGLYMGRLTRI